MIKENKENVTHREATDAGTLKRTYKSRLFEMIFSSKKELLDLYNAVNGTKPIKLPTPCLRGGAGDDAKGKPI